MAVVLCLSPSPGRALASRQVITVPLNPAKTVKDSVEVTELPSSSVSIKVYGCIDAVCTDLVIDTTEGSDEIFHA